MNPQDQDQDQPAQGSGDKTALYMNMLTESEITEVLRQMNRELTGFKGWGWAEVSVEIQRAFAKKNGLTLKVSA